jgi:hypothetical protein
MTRDRMDAPMAAGNALISGTVVTDEQTPQPVRRAQITLVNTDTGNVKNGSTDAAGRFSLAGLPAGRYTLSVSKPGFLRIAYGAKRSDRPGTPITLADRQQMVGVAMKLARGAVIAVIVTDESGLPAFGAQVRVLQYRVVQGERTLAPVPTSNLLGEITDDRGAYRIFGLPPGEYIVSATPRNAIASEIRAMTESEIRAAMMALQQPQLAQSPSGAAAAAQPAPPPPPATTSRLGFTAVYYPGDERVGRGNGDARRRRGTLGRGLRRALRPNGEDRGLGHRPGRRRTAVRPADHDRRRPVGRGGPRRLNFLNRVTAGPDGKFVHGRARSYTLNARANRPAGGAGAGRGAADGVRSSGHRRRGRHEPRPDHHADGGSLRRTGPRPTSTSTAARCPTSS